MTAGDKPRRLAPPHVLSFPTVEEIVAMHLQVPRDRVDPEHDDRGVRDRGRIEAALDAAQFPFMPSDPDLADRAAFLLRMAQDHAFVNGNKRTAFLAADSFLRDNGYAIAVDATAGVAFMLEVAQGAHTLEGWLGGCGPMPANYKRLGGHSHPLKPEMRPRILKAFEASVEENRELLQALARC